MGPFRGWARLAIFRTIPSGPPMMVAMAQPQSPDTRLSRQRLRRYGVLFAIGLQVAVPTVAFLDEHPTRFGFQMFSAQGRIEVEIHDDEGHELDFDPEGMIAGRLRPDLPWASELPQYLCAHVDSAAEVTVTDSSNSRTVTC